MGSERTLRRGLRAAFHQAGGLQLVRWMHRKGLRILMYHRFADSAGLEDQCRHIRENYSPVSLAEVDAWLRTGDPLPLHPIAVTVDDGYCDFAAVAYPVFAAWHIPVTVYLVPDFLDGRIWLWVDQVRFAFLHSPLRRFRTQLSAKQVLDFPLETPELRRRAARETCEILKRQPNAVRLSAMATLSDWLHVAIPENPPAGDQPMAWEDVRRMADGVATFGAHTRTHPVLSRISGEDELNREIEGSKRRIEAVLGRPVEHFCYPNGGPADITPQCVEAVRRAHFHTAVTTSPGLNYRAGNPFLLRRIGVEPNLDAEYFHRCAAAFHV
jgi:peptidoglycan/xylan/chitin deacetylase (PgdA/CDA1 family)